jgi:phenylacetate-CoA oxygenase PaaI subunit
MPKASLPKNTATGGNEALYGLISRLADNKYFLGRRYAEWCSSAPTLESSVAAAAMAQDELGHARALYPSLKTLAPGLGAELEPETRTEFHRLRFLDNSFDGWIDFVTANFLIDTALSVIFEAAQASSYEPLAGRSRKVLQEERTHTLHGQAWARRLARVPETRAAFEASLQRAWDETLCWFGPEGKGDPLSEAKVLNATPDSLRERFLAKVAPDIVASELALPVRETKGTKKGWKLAQPLPWNHWDATRYRLDPAEESVATP